MVFIFDMSSSMLQKLPSGDTKLDAARTAIGRVLRRLPRRARFSVRAYGHQSPDRQRNCRDEARIMPYASGDAHIARSLSQVENLQARGYSPISFALRRAVTSMNALQTPPNTIVLMSDGRETCDGDPCATARRLKRRNPNLVINTVGFAVGDAARQQLACVARATGGSYYAAGDSIQLAARLNDAARPRLARRVVVVSNPEPGQLTIDPATDKHNLRVSDTGELITALGPQRPSATLAPGIYSVEFGNGIWRSIEVTSGTNTVLRPGVLEIRNPSVFGHEIIDPETKKVIGEITPARATLPLVPDRVDIRFGGTLWRGVQIEPGKRVVLEPGVIEIEGAGLAGRNLAFYPVQDATGRVVNKLSIAHPRVVLPPGVYKVKLFGRTQDVRLRSAQTVVLRVR